MIFMWVVFGGYGGFSADYGPAGRVLYPIISIDFQKAAAQAHMYRLMTAGVIGLLALVSLVRLRRVTVVLGYGR